jgi:hypothetical protein
VLYNWNVGVKHHISDALVRSAKGSESLSNYGTPIQTKYDGLIEGGGGDLNKRTLSVPYAGGRIRSNVKPTTRESMVEENMSNYYSGGVSGDREPRNHS